MERVEKTIYISQDATDVLKKRPLPQRERAGGGCTILPRNVYSLTEDGNLPWTRHDLQIVVRGLPLEGKLIDALGQVIVGLRNGQSLFIIVGEQPQLEENMSAVSEDSKIIRTPFPYIHG